jgi:hypothetical protein
VTGIISGADIAGHRLPGAAAPAQLAGITGLPISECACVITGTCDDFSEHEQMREN